MLKHSFLLIYRNFKRFKSTFAINLIGLSTGITCALLIYLWVSDEFSFDKFHEKDKRLFQVMENEVVEGVIKTTGQTKDFLAEVLEEEIPEVELATVVTPPNFFPAFTLSFEDRHVNGVGKFVDKNFLNLFSYPLLQGNSNNALEDKNNILLSETLAKHLFGNIENCIGKSLEWEIAGAKRQVFITGIFQDVPVNSSEQFDFLLTFDSFKELLNMQGVDIDWDDRAPFLTYVVIKEKADIDLLNSKLADFLKSKSRSAQQRSLFLKPYSDNYLYGVYKNGVPEGRIEYVKLFSIIAIFILLIACINFMNLTTAKASRRIKEVGVKKVMGAQRKILVMQYLGESFLMTLLSMITSILFVQMLLPQFSEITGKHLLLNFDSDTIEVLVLIVSITSLLAGAYPALYISGFDLIIALKGKLAASVSGLLARKGLVIFQFAASVIFIVAVLVVYKQIEFIQTKNLGYDKDNVIYFEVKGKLNQRTEAFIQEIKGIPGVLQASSMSGILISGEAEGGGMPAALEVNGKKIVIQSRAVNYDLLELLAIEVKEGRSFSREFDSDKNKVILNEAAVDAFGLVNPVGKMFYGKEILGIVKDFHYQSLHEIVQPLSFRFEPQASTNILAKIKTGTEEETINSLQKFYSTYNPGFLFHYGFLDQQYQSQYVAEQRVAKLSQYAAGMAIIISCLGLFGLTAFSAERRNKEISIRKVLGSSEVEIVILLSNEFIKIVAASIFIALPISYFIATNWLGDFAYRIELEWWYFVSAGLTALLIAWLTIGIQTIKAARINPVDNLRSE